MLKILIVDDVSDDALLGERVLRRAKVLNPIHILRGGDECIQYFRAHGCEAGRDSDACLLFLDMMMPTNGLTVLRTLKDESLAEDSIIVMVSGSDDIKMIQEGYRLGARTFLEKPFKPHDLANVLKSLNTRISIRRSRKGKILNWLPTRALQQRDSELVRRSAAMRPDTIGLSLN